MVDWFLNNALTTMRAEVNSRWPGRDKASDGTIGDEAHQGTSSDHNPDSDGSVDAWDMDVNLYGASGGIPTADIEFLKARFEAHESSQYWIYNRKIASRSYGTTSNGRWVIRDYTGSNPHDQHIHFNTRSSHENSTKPWGIEEEEMDQATFNERMDAWVVRTYECPDNGAAAVLKIRNYMRSFAGVYIGGPLPAGKNWLGVTKDIFDLVTLIAAEVDIDSAELESIRQAAYEGAEAGAGSMTDEQVDLIISGVLAGLSTMGLTPEQEADVATAVRGVFADAGTPDN